MIDSNGYAIAYSIDIIKVLWQMLVLVWTLLPPAQYSQKWRAI
nr:MAG TPA: hypothetical protein [Caudoviricetes sp.]